MYKALSELAYNDYQLNMIDVLEEPDKGMTAGIIGTPTLIYHSADGDITIKSLSDCGLIRRTLGIPE